MSTPPSRSDLARALAAYDDEALTALANKGWSGARQKQSKRAR